MNEGFGRPAGEGCFFFDDGCVDRKHTILYCLNMKHHVKYKLDKEEKDILSSFEKGEWKNVPGMDKEIKRHVEYAKATHRKDKRINIRISAKDLESIQVKALEEGIPYQTLISSLIHKYTTGRLVDKEKIILREQESPVHA